MGYFNFENGKTALNDTNLMAMQKELAKMFYPIGSTYITQDNTNPSTIFGFGTWERLKGKVCIGLDEDDSDEYFDEIGKTGGEKKHTQTVNEMPSHNHAPVGGGRFVEDSGTSQNIHTQAGNSYATQTSGYVTTNTGGGQPMNITQPYEVVGYMWIRRS